MSAFGGLTADGLIQERMRWPPRTGMEMMRTVASRVTSHTPSHYAMLGVPHDFTDAQLRKQHKLLMIRYHPDAAARNNIDPLEAKERFQALQTAYQVLSDPEKRRRYNLELRLQHRRAWSRAWEGPRMLIVDKSSGRTAEGDAHATPPLPHPPPVPRSRLRTGRRPRCRIRRRRRRRRRSSSRRCRRRRRRYHAHPPASHAPHARRGGGVARPTRRPRASASAAR